MSWKAGGCHCGAVRYEVLAPDEIEAKECNCSICRMTGYVHLIVPAERFRLLQGGDALTTYSFNTGTAKHHFCSVCGIKSFYVPRSKPDGYQRQCALPRRRRGSRDPDHAVRRRALGRGTWRALADGRSD